MGDKKLHARKNSVCLFLSIDLKAKFLPGCAEVGAGFLSKLYLSFPRPLASIRKNANILNWYAFSCTMSPCAALLTNTLIGKVDHSECIGPAQKLSSSR